MRQLKVISIDRMPSVKRAEVIFEGGTVDIKMLIDRPVGAEETKVAIVTFFPGTKTKMHSHYHEQLLYIPSGKGIVANEHEEHGATLGKVFLIPAGESTGTEPLKIVASHICSSSNQQQRPLTRSCKPKKNAPGFLTGLPRARLVSIERSTCRSSLFLREILRVKTRPPGYFLKCLSCVFLGVMECDSAVFGVYCLFIDVDDSLSQWTQGIG